jgi:hypothetical protein
LVLQEITSDCFPEHQPSGMKLYLEGISFECRFIIAYLASDLHSFVVGEREDAKPAWKNVMNYLLFTIHY